MDKRIKLNIEGIKDNNSEIKDFMRSISTESDTINNNLQDIIINDPNIIGGSTGEDMLLQPDRDSTPQSPKYGDPDFIVDDPSNEGPTYAPGSPPPANEGLTYTPGSPEVLDSEINDSDINDDTDIDEESIVLDKYNSLNEYIKNTDNEKFINKINSKYPLNSWDLIHTYFRDTEYYKVQHQLDSYNEFIYSDSNGIRHIIQRGNPQVILKEPTNADNTQFKYEIQIYYGETFEESINGQYLDKDTEPTELNKIYLTTPSIYDIDTDKMSYM